LEISRILQPEIPGSFQLRAILLLLAPHFINGLIEDLQNMELVKGQVGFRKVILYALDESRRHIAANLPDGRRITMMCLQIGLEPPQRRGILPFGGKQNPRRLQIYKQRGLNRG
ncbi:MAG TPA: hypothetical protein PLV50_14930, partial [Smithella sp.]|nr:hypothetical protein [Smithella sp.]